MNNSELLLVGDFIAFLILCGLALLASFYTIYLSVGVLAGRNQAQRKEQQQKEEKWKQDKNKPSLFD